MSQTAYCFRPVHRLRLAREYSAVFSHRQVLRGGIFELYLKPRALSDLDHVESITARLGLVVPKRNAKRAVHRNLVKRLAREAFRHVYATLPKYDLVLRLGRPLLQKNGTAQVLPARAEIRQQIETLFVRMQQRVGQG